jgi:hypothetical protein
LGNANIIIASFFRAAIFLRQPAFQNSFHRFPSEGKPLRKALSQGQIYPQKGDYGHRVAENQFPD